MQSCEPHVFSVFVNLRHFSLPMDLSTRDVALLGAGAGLGYIAARYLTSSGADDLDLDDATLQYFPIPALGEPIRLMYHLAGLKLNDVRIKGLEWKELKSKMPASQMPVLTLRSGKQMTQSRAIVRLLGRIAADEGVALYPPNDATTAYAIDEITDMCMDIQRGLASTFSLDGDARKAARQSLFHEGGKCIEAAQGLESMLGRYSEAGGGNGAPFAVGSTLSTADIFIFTWLNSMRCGFLDDVDPDFLRAFPNMARVVKAVASHPQVMSYYAGKDEGVYHCFNAGSPKGKWYA